MQKNDTFATISYKKNLAYIFSKVERCIVEKPDAAAG